MDDLLIRCREKSGNYTVFHEAADSFSRKITVEVVESKSRCTIILTSTEARTLVDWLVKWIIEAEGLQPHDTQSGND